ncbi:MAG: FG-GAP repeat domain-containing protein, partial [Verrucomicrobiales bacterium]
PSPAASVPADKRAATAPALSGQNLIDPLRSAYERMDPSKDGWESEAFSEKAKKQLHHLEELLTAEGLVNPAALGDLVVESFASVPLRPASTSKVFEDGRLLVLRAFPLPDTTSPGPAALAESLNRIKSAGTTIEPHFKIYRVSRVAETAVTTSVLVDIEARSAESRRQINATWSCDWQTSPEHPPRLQTIRLEKYEEVVQARDPGALFSDATAALLDSNPSYQDQFLTSTDHWRARLPRDLGLDAVANHGLAVGDINGDDLDDLYICQQGGLPNRMFLQQADGTLRDVTDSSGTGWLDYCAAALLIDLDNDGDRDLIISQDFRVLVMSNDGRGVFTLEFGSNTKAQSFSLAAADYDNDGLVDFYICGYNTSHAERRGGAMPEPVPFHDANNGGPNMLWRNEGDFKFTDVTSRTGHDQNNTRFTFAAAWEDYDNDGDQDLYLANDYGRNCLFRNDGGNFSDVAADLRVEDTSSGMSVSWGDFNRDGIMDLYTSNMFSSAGNRITYQGQFKPGVDEEVRKQFQHIALGNSLFQGVAGAPFKDVSVEAGVTMGRWAWGSRFVDFNNDGLEDILVANGFITSTDTDDL